MFPCSPKQESSVQLVQVCKMCASRIEQHSCLHGPIGSSVSKDTSDFDSGSCKLVLNMHVEDTNDCRGCSQLACYRRVKFATHLTKYLLFFQLAFNMQQPCLHEHPTLAVRLAHPTNYATRCSSACLQGLSSLIRLTALTKMAFRQVDMDNGAMRSIAACLQLRDLTLETAVEPFTLVTLAGLMRLTQLTALTRLSLEVKLYGNLIDPDGGCIDTELV